MGSSMEWNLVRSPGIVLIGRHMTDHEPTRGVEKAVLVDLNMTLIVSKSGSLHGKNEQDWKWWHEKVPAKLRSLNQEGYRIVIVSNQGRLTKNGKQAPEAESFKQKMASVLKELGVPTIIMVACANDICRKPRVGMWSLLTQLLGATIDTSQSFVVGDAAGRETDYSDIDRHFSMNLGIGFYTPEMLFLNATTENLGHKFDPSWYLPGSESNEQFDHTIRLHGPPHRSRMILLVGLPGAGKTTYYYRFLRDFGYELISSRSWGDINAGMDDVKKLISEGKSVVIDDINIDIKSRTAWLALAREHDVKVVALQFVTNTDLCLHNDSFRALAGGQYNPEQRPIYPRIPFLELVSAHERVSADEGFETVINVEFRWAGTDEDLEVWKKYWH